MIWNTRSHKSTLTVLNPATSDKANNPWKMSEFSTKAPGMDWNSYFAGAGLSSPMIMVWHPTATTGISALVASQPLDVWKDYLVFRVSERSSFPA